MKISEIKERIGKVKPRAKKLWEMYPVLSVSIVAAAWFCGGFVGFVIGFVVGKP